MHPVNLNGTKRANVTSRLSLLTFPLPLEARELSFWVEGLRAVGLVDGHVRESRASGEL